MKSEAFTIFIRSNLYFDTKFIPLNELKVNNKENKCLLQGFSKLLNVKDILFDQSENAIHVTFPLCNTNAPDFQLDSMQIYLKRSM